jgi:hypothetical protein
MRKRADRHQTRSFGSVASELCCLSGGSNLRFDMSATSPSAISSELRKNIRQSSCNAQIQLAQKPDNRYGRRNNRQQQTVFRCSFKADSNAFIDRRSRVQKNSENRQ